MLNDITIGKCDVISTLFGREEKILYKQHIVQCEVHIGDEDVNKEDDIDQDSKQKCQSGEYVQWEVMSGLPLGSSTQTRNQLTISIGLAQYIINTFSKVFILSHLSVLIVC